MIPRHELLINKSGFLVNGEVKIVVRIEVFQVIGKADIVFVESEEECKEEPEEASRPLHSGSRISMRKKKYTWVIKDYYSLRSEEIIVYDKFVIGGCKWRLMAYPRGDRNSRFMSSYLDVADPQSLPCGWRRHAKFTLKVVNQLSRKDSRELGKNNVFDQKTLASGFVTMIRRCDIGSVDGFLVNKQVKIVVELNLLEVIGKVDVPEESGKEDEDESDKDSEEDDEAEEESQETGRPLKKMKLNNNDGAVSSDDDDIHNETQQGRETVNVHGFHVLPSQVELVSRIFKKYPDIALEYRAKNQHLRTACVNVLLSLMETLCQSPQELSNEDLVESDNALGYVKDAGFKVDWLEKKLAEVKDKKEEEQTGETRIQEFEEEFKDFKHKCLHLEALLVKEKAKVLAARVSLTLDEFV